MASSCGGYSGARSFHPVSINSQGARVQLSFRMQSLWRLMSVRLGVIAFPGEECQRFQAWTCDKAGQASRRTTFWCMKCRDSEIATTGKFRLRALRQTSTTMGNMNPRPSFERAAVRPVHRFHASSLLAKIKIHFFRDRELLVFLNQVAWSLLFFWRA